MEKKVVAARMLKYNSAFMAVFRTQRPVGKFVFLAVFSILLLILCKFCLCEHEWKHEIIMKMLILNGLIIFLCAIFSEFRLFGSFYFLIGQLMSNYFNEYSSTRARNDFFKRFEVETFSHNLRLIKLIYFHDFKFCSRCGTQINLFKLSRVFYKMYTNKLFILQSCGVI